MKTLITLLFSSILTSSLLYAEKLVLPNILDPKIDHEESIKPPSIFNRTGPTVQIGILLDTSNSMDGLINQAKDQLWKIVNEVAKANINNEEVTIQVGLFEYGKSSLPKYEGFLQMLVPLSDDLDKVSKSLFSLRTQGGDEYAGKVILDSVNRFAWSTHKDDLRLLIISGNETFNQGEVPYKKAIKKAVDYGIIVNTIFCGPLIDGKKFFWEDAAKRGKGKYFNINQNDKRVFVATPFDDEIIALGKKLNKTYLNYGAKSYRDSKTKNIMVQDENSMAYSKESYIERNLVKSKKQYASSSFDLISAYSKDDGILEKVKKDNLPDELQAKSNSEIKEVLESKKKQRIKLQQDITNLERKRIKFLSKNKDSNEKTFSEAILSSIKEQAKLKGYKFKE